MVNEDKGLEPTMLSNLATLDQMTNNKTTSQTTWIKFKTKPGCLKIPRVNTKHVKTKLCFKVNLKVSWIPLLWLLCVLSAMCELTPDETPVKSGINGEIGLDVRSRSA